MKLEYFKSLNGLRTIAALMVIVAHFFTLKNSFNSVLFYKIAKFGNSGVSLFFVLSGFVITRILLNSINSNNYFKAFYVRRTLRIFPLYYLALVCYYYLPNLLDSLYQFSPLFSQRVYYYIYLQNLARTFNWSSSGPIHFWTLSVEEHFYLLWPAIVYLGCRFERTWLLYISGLLLLLPLLLRFRMLSSGYVIEFFTFTRLDQLVLGGILAILEHKGLLNTKYKRAYIIITLAGAAFFIFCSFFNDFYQDVFKHDALGMFYFGIIALCVIYEHKGSGTKLLKLPVMQYLGTISYGIYVWHALAIDIVEHYLGTYWILLNFSLVVLLTVFISSISYWLVEKPFLNLKRFFSYG